MAFLSSAYLPKSLLLGAVILCTVSVVQNTQYPVEGPPLPNRPFITVWNTPSNKCESKWHVPLNLSAFDFVVNSAQGWQGEHITIFYSAQIGLYPYFESDGSAINGGLPQLVNFTDHFKKVEEDIDKVIPDPDFQGLGIIDWESWRPVFDRNWDTFLIYRTKSIELVKQVHPSWPESLIEKIARLEFENAARELMEGTVLLAQTLRPKSRWGFYGFPHCHNYQASRGQYTCSNITMERNDQISWMFKSSSALFPSIYIPSSHDFNTTLFVKYRLMEGLRHARKLDGQMTPMYPYVSITYAITDIYVTEGDVMATVAQSAEYGTAGVVIWGDHFSDRTKEDCLEIQTYIEKNLGPLVRHLTEITQHCTVEFCNLHGRCTFQLNPSVYAKPLRVGLMQDLTDKWTFVKCNCDQGWRGEDCSEQRLV